MVVTVRMMMGMVKLVRVTRMARMARVTRMASVTRVTRMVMMARVTRIVRMARVRRMARVTWMARIIGRQKKGGGWSSAGSVVGVIGRGCCSRLVVSGYRGFGSAWVWGAHLPVTYLPYMCELRPFAFKPQPPGWSN